jgi:hypothetical protein
MHNLVTQKQASKVFNGLPKAVRNKGVQAYVSDTVFQWFEEDNRRNHGESGYFKMLMVIRFITYMAQTTNAVS